MRILSWNVNGIRAVEGKGFVDWLGKESPDLLCVQETKAHEGQLSDALKRPIDGDGRFYNSWFASAKRPGYSGVAIYSRLEPTNVRTMGVDAFDDEGRVLVAEFSGAEAKAAGVPELAVISAYFPNSQDAGARLPYKLDFCEAMLDLCKSLVGAGKKVLLCGDYNIAHTPIDLARPAENEGNPGYLPAERAWMDAFTSSGFHDTFRLSHPGEKNHYSWWSYRMRAREKNIGWRIDYHCVDSALLPSVNNSIIRPDVLGSDHCPVEIELCR